MNKVHRIYSLCNSRLWFRGLIHISLIALICGCSFGTRYIFKTNKIHQGTPEDLGIPYEDVRFNSEDGIELHGWYISGDPEMPLIFFLHGNAANITFRLENISYFHKLGFSIFIFDYRGFGDSDGRALYEEDLLSDSKGALTWLRGKNWSPESSIYYGRSLGAAVAIKLALQQPPMGIVLEAPFTSLHDIAPQIDPTSYYLFGFWSIGNSFDNLANIQGLSSPLLIIHGDNDKIIPLEMSRKLFSRAPTPKKLLVVEGANHSNSFSVGGNIYRKAWLDFVDLLLNVQKNS